MNLEIKENLPKCKRALRPDHGRLSWCSSTDHNALGEERCRLLGLCDFSKRNITWEMEDLLMSVTQCDEMIDAKQKTRDVLASISHHISGQGTTCGHGHHWISCRTKCQGEEIGADMLLTQGVPYIDREELGLSYISCPLLLRF